MGHIKTEKPTPNMNKEFMFGIHPTGDGKIGIYDISRYLEPYNGRERDNKLAMVTHEIHGKTATVYIVDEHATVTREQAIKLAGKFINGDFDTYRLD